MSSKKVSIGAKPTNPPAAAPAAADAWVENRVIEEVAEPMKRLTIDVPESLHRAIKSQCAARGRKINEELREILQEKYGSQDG